MKTVQQWRDFCRLYIDADAEDMPDAVIDGWLEDACRVIRQREVAWPFFQATGTITTAVYQQAYDAPLSSEGADFRDIIEITGPWDFLRRLSHREAQTAYFLPNGAMVQSSYPESYSLWAGKIYIWPKPDKVFTMQVRGYRDLLAWNTGAGAVPDLRDEFEPALRDWMIYESLLHAQDPESADIFKKKFDSRLQVLLEDQLRPSLFGPVTMGDRFNRRIAGHGGRFPHWLYR